MPVKLDLAPGLRTAKSCPRWKNKVIEEAELMGIYAKTSQRTAKFGTTI